MIKIIFILLTLLMLGCSSSSSGKNATGATRLNRNAIADYLDQHGLNTAGVADNVTFALNEGNRFREKITDKNGRGTMLTAWIDNQEQSVFCLTYYRDEKCADCNGTGKREPPQMLSMKSPIAFTCRECKGTGILLNQFHRKCWVLSAEEYVDRSAAREQRQHIILEGAPPQTDEYAAKLSSEDPQERLTACEWLDKNYIRAGQFFQQLAPILDRAHYVGKTGSGDGVTGKIIGKRLGNDGATIYQFIAGRGAIDARAYYRIYIDNNSGKVIKTMFVAETAKR